MPRCGFRFRLGLGPEDCRGGVPPEGKLRAVEDGTAGDSVVMVGDGASDLEVKGDADKVIGFGRYAVRAKVKAKFPQIDVEGGRTAKRQDRPARS